MTPFNLHAISSHKKLPFDRTLLSTPRVTAFPFRLTRHVFQRPVLGLRLVPGTVRAGSGLPRPLPRRRLLANVVAASVATGVDTTRPPGRAPSAGQTSTQATVRTPSQAPAVEVGRRLHVGVVVTDTQAEGPQRDGDQSPPFRVQGDGPRADTGGETVVTPHAETRLVARVLGVTGAIPVTPLRPPAPTVVVPVDHARGHKVGPTDMNVATLVTGLPVLLLATRTKVLEDPTPNVAGGGLAPLVALGTRQLALVLHAVPLGTQVQVEVVVLVEGATSTKAVTYVAPEVLHIDVREEALLVVDTILLGRRGTGEGLLVSPTQPGVPFRGGGGLGDETTPVLPEKAPRLGDAAVASDLLGVPANEVVGHAIRADAVRTPGRHVPHARLGLATAKADRNGVPGRPKGGRIARVDRVGPAPPLA